MRTAVIHAIRAAVMASPVEPDRLALTTQMAGLIRDRHGCALGPAILGIDRRGQEFATESDPRTACPPGGIYPAHKLRWLSEHVPAGRRRHRIGGIKEYLLLRLTGRWVTDRSSASVMGPVPTSDAGPGSRRIRACFRRSPRPWRLPAASIRLITGLPVAVPVPVGVGDGPAASLACGAVGRHRLCPSVGTTIVARLLLDDVPEPDAAMFVQQLDDGWRSIGIRFDADASGMYAAVGSASPGIPAAGIPDAVHGSRRTGCGNYVP